VGHTDIIDYFDVCRTRQHKSELFFLSLRGKKKECKRTEHADFDWFELLEKCLPSGVICRCKVDNERLGLYTSSTATCVDYNHAQRFDESQQKVEEKKNSAYAPISSTTASSLAWFRAARRTLNPALASWIANSRPMPSDAPVTTNEEQAPTRHATSCKVSMWWRRVYPIITHLPRHPSLPQTS
jgi:hypothetical protein